MSDNCELCGKPGADMAFHFGPVLGRIHADCLDGEAAATAFKLVSLRLGCEGRDDWGSKFSALNVEEQDEIMAPADVKAWKRDDG